MNYYIYSKHNLYRQIMYGTPERGPWIDLQQGYVNVHWKALKSEIITELLPGISFERAGWANPRYKTVIRNINP